MLHDGNFDTSLISLMRRCLLRFVTICFKLNVFIFSLGVKRMSVRPQGSILVRNGLGPGRPVKRTLDQVVHGDAAMAA